MPLNLDGLLTLDDTSRSINVYQNWLLYTSLTISILVAALAMAAKLWVVRYSREVASSGPPRARAKRRQEVYSGMLAWKLEYCIDAMPVMSLISVILFALFIEQVDHFWVLFRGIYTPLILGRPLPYDNQPLHILLAWPSR
jgi:hypothetical protein